MYINQAQQAVLNAENSVSGLEMNSLQTGNLFLQTSGAVEQDLSNQAAAYASDTAEAAKIGGFFSSSSVVSTVMLAAGIMGVCVAPEGTIFNIANGVANSGEKALMVTQTVGPSVSAVYQTKAADRNYNVSMDTASMTQMSKSAGVFAGETNQFSQTERAIAAALSAEITNVNAGEKSTTKYGG